jgi:hypothetical protein
VAGPAFAGHPWLGLPTHPCFCFPFIKSIVWYSNVCIKVDFIVDCALMPSLFQPLLLFLYLCHFVWVFFHKVSKGSSVSCTLLLLLVVVIVVIVVTR